MASPSTLVQGLETRAVQRDLNAKALNRHITTESVAGKLPGRDGPLFSVTTLAYWPVRRVMVRVLV